MNYKTTISGIFFVGALCGFLATITNLIPELEPVKGYLLAAAAIAGFVNTYFQKDKDMTGGTRNQ